MSSRNEAGSPNLRDEGTNAGCLALQSGEEVTIFSLIIPASSSGTSGIIKETLVYE